MSVPDGFCPYVGLQPYTEADRDYFFGRERDQRIIASNLYAAPLTVLYGASGVGKSSVLLAGVVPDLSSAPRTVVVVFREWQGAMFLDGGKSMSTSTDPQGDNYKAVYQELCTSYRAIDDFRTKLLGFLPLATAGGIFLVLKDLTEETKRFLEPIGAFGFVITLGLFFYELHGIRQCHHLQEVGRHIECELRINGQFRNRPHGAAWLINEPLAAGVIYPAVLASWMVLALYCAWPQATLVRWAIGVFLGGLTSALLLDVWLNYFRKTKSSVA